MKDKKDILWRMYVVYFVACLFGVAILVKIFTIQLVNGDQWEQRLSEEKYFFKTISAARGNIFSDDNNLLATSVPIYTICIDPNADAINEELWDSTYKPLAKGLADLFGDRSQQEYERRLKKARTEKKRYLVLKKKVRYDQLLKVKQLPLLSRGRYKGGLLVEQQNKREKPYRMLAHRTIGYERPGIKPVGLEGAYSKELRGVEGKRLMKKLPGGVYMPINDENEIEPENGADIVTTIDVHFQDIVETALMDQLKYNEADHGSAVLMEVATGRVKAIANLTRGDDGDYYEKYNYAVGESTEPGSTFKLLSLMSMLDQGLVKLTDSVDAGNGSYDFYNTTMHDSKRGGYGKITVEEAFAHSSNIAIAKKARDCYVNDERKFTDKLYQTHVNRPLGLEISGEGSPFVKTAGQDNWSGISLTQMAIGYELQMTPMQTLAYYNAIANNGKMMKPTFVSEIRRNGFVERILEPEVLDEAVVSDYTVTEMKKAMEAVFEYGTGKTLRNARFNMAGKTGTARIANAQYGYNIPGEKYSYQASFAGYFPAETPRYSCIVVVHAPQVNGYYGAAVAGPVFKKIAEKVYAMSLEIHESIDSENAMALENVPVSKNGNQTDLQRVFATLDVPMTINDPGAEYVSTNTGDNEVAMNELNVDLNTPNVVGMGLMDALYLLENRGKRVIVVGTGVVKKQTVSPENKNLITLELS